MYDFQFQTVSRIISGLGSIQELRTILPEQRCQKVLLVTDICMLQQQLHLPLLEILEHLHLPYVIYADVIADPPEQIVHAAIEFAIQEQVDTVIGFGGGSSLDVAKLIAVLAHPDQQQKLSDLYGINQAKPPRLPLILVPTTAGTGSEVTPTALS